MSSRSCRCVVFDAVPAPRHGTANRRSVRNRSGRSAAAGMRRLRSTEMAAAPACYNSQVDEGFRCAWFEGEIIEHVYPNKCSIRYLELREVHALLGPAHRSEPK